MARGMNHLVFVFRASRSRRGTIRLGGVIPSLRLWVPVMVVLVVLRRGLSEDGGEGEEGEEEEAGHNA